jgi:hypothetical protein
MAVNAILWTSGEATRQDTYQLQRGAGAEPFYDGVIAACHAAGFSPLIGQDAPCIVSTLNLVAAGLDLSGARVVAEDAHGWGDLTLPDRGPGRRCILRAPVADTSPVVRRFLALVTRTFA